MLAQEWATHPDELTADFQEFYGINLWSIGLDQDEDTPEIRRAAALLSQLPPSARVLILENPDLSWNNESHLLRQLEYDLRALCHALGGNKGQKPKPVDLPSERIKHEKAIASAERNQDEIYEILKDVFPK